MFDDLHDPAPPRPDDATLIAVYARSARRRRRRRGLGAGLAVAILLAGGVAVAAASNGGPGPTITDRAPVTEEPTTPPDTAPRPDTTGPETTSPDATGPDATSPDTTSPGVTGPGVTGPDQTDPALPGAIPYLAIGDAVMLGAAPVLAGAGIVVDAQEARQLVDVVPTVQQLRTGGHLDETLAVVLHLGTNGPISATSLDALMAELDAVPNVIVLTVHADRSWVADNNELLRGLDGRPNVIVVDWESLAPMCPGECFASDRIHLRASGQRYYAGLIADVLGLDLSSSSAGPVAPGERFAATDEWRELGGQIVGIKAELDGLPMFDVAADDARPVALLSDPVDIVGPGTYVLEFPISDDGDVPAGTLGGLITHPPDISFDYEVGHLSVVEHGGGAHTLTMELHVGESGFGQGYPGFSLWLS